MKTPIQLKNFLKEVEDAVKAQGLRWDDVESLLGKARELLEDEDFWKHQREGLALFMAPGFFRSYRLPIEVPAKQVVADAFDIRPLLPMLANDGHFYILAISENEVRLFDASRYGVQELRPDGVPTSMAEALWSDTNEKQIQWHSGAGASPGGHGRSAMFFGTGPSTGMEQHKVDYKRYFDKVDAALSPFLTSHPAPVVLAGVQYLLPIYRDANTCAQILDGEVHGGPEHKTAEDLHEGAWEMASKHFGLAREKALDRFHELHEKGQATTDLDQIAAGATSGRIETLFLSESDGLEAGTEVGGRLNAAAVDTLAKGGDVFVIASTEIPSQHPAAASFRY